MGPPAATAAVRVAVRRALTQLAVAPGQGVPLVLVACSGGPDSVALASATAFVAPRVGWRAGLLTVDHGLQAATAEVSAGVVTWATGAGLAPVELLRVRVQTEGGPEAAARTARRTALRDAALRHGAVALLLAHTLDDQAETVLLGLGRGSGQRSLAGMRPVVADGPVAWVRPLLAVDRATVHTAAAETGLPVWHDPHNHDGRYARVRVRHEALPALERALGPGVAAALARTATLAGEDADALEELALAAFGKVVLTPPPDPNAAVPPPVALDVALLRGLPPAVRTRVLRLAALRAGSPATELTRAHVVEVQRLVTDWHGQGPLRLPGPVAASRRSGRIEMRHEQRDASR